MGVLALAARGDVQYDHFLFCNVGDDSENPATLAYVKEYAEPFAAEHGLSLITLQRHRRDGSVETLKNRIDNAQRSVPLCMRMSNGAPGNRTCTADFKIRVVAKWVKQHGATATRPATVGIGISWDEWQRAKTESGFTHEVIEHPLLERRLTRADCDALTLAAGLPIPPKSSCYFCPMHSPAEWRRIKHDSPELFWQAVEIERAMGERRATLGKDRVWLTRFAKPLDEVVAGDQLTLDDELESCDSGYCFR